MKVPNLIDRVVEVEVAIHSRLTTPLVTLVSFCPTSAQPQRPFSTRAPQQHQTRTMATSPPPMPAKWQLVSWQKKDEQFNRIPAGWRLPRLPSKEVINYIDVPRKCGILSQQELHITEAYDATSLAEAIRKRELKCVDVARAFCKV